MRNVKLPVILLMMVCGVTAAQSIVIEKPDAKMPPPQLGISPPQIDQSLVLGTGNVINQSVTIHNYNSKPKLISITMIDVNRRQQPIRPNDKTLSTWTILNPTSFTVAGNGQQTIRLSIRPPVGFPKKTHYAMLKIEQQIHAPLKVDEQNKNITITLGSSYGLAVKVNIR